MLSFRQPGSSFSCTSPLVSLQNCITAAVFKGGTVLKSVGSLPQSSNRLSPFPGKAARHNFASRSIYENENGLECDQANPRELLGGQGPALERCHGLLRH